MCLAVSRSSVFSSRTLIQIQVHVFEHLNTEGTSMAERIIIEGQYNNGPLHDASQSLIFLVKVPVRLPYEERDELSSTRQLVVPTSGLKNKLLLPHGKGF